MGSSALMLPFLGCIVIGLMFGLSLRLKSWPMYFAAIAVTFGLVGAAQRRLFALIYSDPFFSHTELARQSLILWLPLAGFFALFTAYQLYKMGK